ncbi:MAG: ribose-phosphate diphosphokinase [bacterium]|nr:ribose-phosphate diphosphokinase [bacterium]
MESKLKLVVPKNFEDFGKKVNQKLKLIRNTDENYIIDMKLERFNNGEGKCVLNESVRGCDIYILSDISNYDVTYECQRGIHYMMPDEHYQDIKRILSAMSGHADKITVVMPLLYQSRQDKRSSRESLDCAMALQDLMSNEVRELVTFDAHNPTVANAVPNKMTFSNGYATGDMILDMIKNENLNTNKIFVVSPDEGAISKARFLADILGGNNYGNFVKRRNYDKLEGGSHPITYHEFKGPKSLEGMDVILIDDMIATGGSLIDSAKRLKERRANHIYLMTTFALFTKGIDKFEEAYNLGIFDKLYSTNLAYVPEEYKSMPWFHSVDCSSKVANIISDLNEGKSIRHFLNGKEETAQKIKTLSIHK